MAYENKKAAFKKLLEVQKGLKAPKDKKNSFGGYNYRSCESILEAVKPILDKTNSDIILTDKMSVLADRVYVEATAVFVDFETGETIEVTSSAREPLTKKGMDDSQVTGATSSYARKCALGGLLLVDDNKDPDSMAPDGPEEKAKQPVVLGKAPENRPKTRNELIATLEGLGVNLLAVANWKGVEADQLTEADLQEAIDMKVAKNQKKIGGKAALDNLQRA
jgi:hypothetical protein